MESINGIDVFLLLCVIGLTIYARHLDAMRALAYLDGWIDGRSVVASKAQREEKVYDWEVDGL